MSEELHFAIIGGTIGACFGYALSYLFGFDPYIGILLGIVAGAVSPFIGDA